jgi:hypothetical protein
LKALSERLSQDHADALRAGRFRFGTAQKALNLYLKYLWCIGRVPTPPHCPFDYQVISTLPGWQAIKRTALTSRAKYLHLVAAARKRADGVPLAEWELKLYNPVSSI